MRDGNYCLCLDAVCNVYNKAVGDGKGPQLVLDFTWSGLSSEAMKAFSRKLALPTVSGSYGGVGDIK